MTVRVRFAPSPTGKLHLGNINRAVLNYLFARNKGGTFVLRLDDTDLERSTEENAESIKFDLKWLGLEWDEFHRQTDRFDRYDDAFKRLVEAGRLYPCYETPDELAIKRKVQLSRGLPPIYDRAALQLTDAEKKEKEAEGVKPHWRFKLEHKDITWNDLCRGPVKFEGAKLSDPVLFKTDGRPLFSLASVVDDIDLKMTHVIRGDDHVSNTAAQVQIFEALGADVPEFAHYPLIMDKEGKKLSKRTGALGMDEIREQGFEPLTIAAVMAALGTSKAAEGVESLEALTKTFDLGAFGKASPKFNPEDMWPLNAKILHVMPYDQALVRLQDLGLPEVPEFFWNAVRPNLKKLSDITEWWDMCQGGVEPVIEDADFIAKAAELLPSEPWSAETWSTWTSAVKESTGAKGKELFMPLRLAITGKPHGPELKDLLPLIGREKVEQRLQQAKAA